MENNMDIYQLYHDLKKKQDELYDAKMKLNAANNHTLNKIVEQITYKIVKDTLYKNQDLDNRYVHTLNDPHDFSEGVFLKNYEEVGDKLREVGIRDDTFSDVLSITFNIKYDDELKEIMNQNWEVLDG